MSDARWIYVPGQFSPFRVIPGLRRHKVRCVRLYTFAVLSLFTLSCGGDSGGGSSSSGSGSGDSGPWTQVTGTAGFSARSGHTVAVFNDGIQDAGTAFDDGTRDALWVIGGWNGSDDLNDVWKSTDGITWDDVTTDAGFLERSDHSTAVFDDKSGSGEALWVIGGWSNYLDTYHNDVWKSTDGKNWTEVTSDAAFTRRMWHSTVVFDDKSGSGDALWVIGGWSGGDGMGGGTLKDVWKSTDGKNWTEVTADGPVFTGRSGHSVTVFNDGSGDALWVIGGDDDSNLFDGRNDVWKSTDGKTWTKVKENNNIGFSARQYHTATVFKDGSGDALWVIGGKFNDNSNYNPFVDNSKYFNDVWKYR